MTPAGTPTRGRTASGARGRGAEPGREGPSGGLPALAGLAAAALALLAPVASAPLPAQTPVEWDAPSFHLPGGEDGYGVYLTFPRDVGAVGATGTWRRSGEYVDLGVRAGAANVENVEGNDALALSAGLELKNELVHAYEEFPLDVSWATGVGVTAVPERDASVLRVPVGLVVGRRVPAGEATVTPYAHPRVALDAFFRDEGPGPGPDGDETDLRLDLDFGVDVRTAEEWSVRLGFTVGRDFTAGAGITF